MEVVKIYFFSFGAREKDHEVLIWTPDPKKHELMTYDVRGAVLNLVLV